MSDIGEQWSPQTAPAIHAEIDIIIIVWFIPENVPTTIGMRIPNVPHDVPVANASNAPIINIIAGNSESHGPDKYSTNEATN